MKLIPIYTKIIKDGQNYTIFLDEKTRYTYKAYHKDSGPNFFYWIGFVIVLYFLREIQEITFSFSNTINIGIIMAVIVLGIIAGKYYYKKFGYEDVKEIYLTESMIEDYIEKGRKVFKIDMWVIVISLIIFLSLIISFYITSSLVLLIFSFAALVFIRAYLFRLPKERIMLYKNSSN